MNMTRWILSLSLGLLALTAWSAEPLPVWYPAPNFKLTDQDGRDVSTADLRGKTWIVNFIFTRCPGPCPLMTQRLVGVAKGIASPDVRFVSVSVDPKHDKPDVLKAYAQQRGATDPRMLFLTGEGKQIYQLVKSGFKLVAEPASETTPIVHDERFLLVDASGNVRGAYHVNDADAMARLAVDAQGLATGATPAASPGATSPERARMLARFPALNASLNATAGIFLCIGMMLIKARMIRAHAAFMIGAIVASTLFLGCYVTYHVMKEGLVTIFPQSPWRPLYLAVLISHTILAIAVVPLVVMTVLRAWRRQWDRHTRIARPTFWIWLYVSVTGVIVYWMLYHLAPKISGAA
jgi:protein SCO1/2/putative membrane protein